ncbi:MAG: glycosyltransferase [Candidatus Diapherotrites archaeon]|nr:glycosyltransferase [Candidatus Diapherotrites archaeon]
MLNHWRQLVWRLRQKAAREVGSPLDFWRVGLGLWRGLHGTDCKEIQLSVVTVVRNRCGIRERNCLRSLMRQTLPRNCYEVLVMDYGSAEPEKIAALVRGVDKGIRYSFVEAPGAFNLPKAKNVGAGLARGEKILFTNFDDVFQANALEAVLLALRGQQKLFVEIRRLDFPEERVEGTDLVNGFEGACRLPGVNPNPRAGDVQALDKRALMEVLNGFDEAFEGWGAQDTDIRMRAVNAGFRCLNLFPLTSILHQNHDSLHALEGRDQNYRKNRAWLEAKPLNAVKANEGKRWDQAGRQ